MRPLHNIGGAHFAAAVLLIASCAKGPACDQHFMGAQDSPDGTQQAVILEEHCSGATHATSYLMIGAAHTKLGDGVQRVAVFEGTGMQLKWRGADLVVIYGAAKPVTTPAIANGAHIEYLESEPATNLGTLH